MVKVSVVIPAYNAEKSIRATLDCLSKQNYSNFEVIVVDDFSSDSTSFAASSVKVIRNETNMGPAASRNVGIHHSKGEIIAFTDDDCIVPFNWVLNIVKHFENEQGISVVAGDTKIPPAGFLGDSISLLGFPGGGNVGFEKMWHVSPSGLTDHFTSCNFAARKSVFERYGYFDESFPLAGGEDPELAYRLVRQGCKIRFCPDVIVHHPARRTLSSFISWQLKRGESYYYFKRKVGRVSGFLKLRLWSSKNVVLHSLFSLRIFLVVPLLFLSFFLQQAGYLKACFKKS